MAQTLAARLGMSSNGLLRPAFGRILMRILFAEREKELANWLVRTLGQIGFQVEGVDDGRMVRH